jgi:hypothetical protein
MISLLFSGSFYDRMHRHDLSLALALRALALTEQEVQILSVDTHSDTKLQRLRYDLAIAHKRVGHIYHLSFLNSNASLCGKQTDEIKSCFQSAKEHFQLAMDLGLYDMDIRGFFALPLPLRDNQSSTTEVTTSEKHSASLSESINGSFAADTHIVTTHSSSSKGTSGLRRSHHRWVIRSSMADQQGDRVTSEIRHSSSNEQPTLRMSSLDKLSRNHQQTQWDAEASDDELEASPLSAFEQEIRAQEYIQAEEKLKASRRRRFFS